MADRTVPLTRIYDNDYFTSTQCSIYIGDVWVDEVTSISYQRQQNKQPIYGYASQLYDDCSAGQVIVHGSFSINFKEQGYLWAVLRRWHSLDSDALQAMGIKDPVNARKARALILNKLGADPSGMGGRPVIGSNGSKISRDTIERIVDGDAPISERYEFYNNLAGYSTFDIDSPRDRIFEDIVEAFEDEVWKTAENPDLIDQARNVDNNLFDGFDMFVLFGNYANARANHTVRKLIDVRITSEGKTIQIDDQPIQEHYTFIARTTA